MDSESNDWPAYFLGAAVHELGLWPACCLGGANRGLGVFVFILLVRLKFNGARVHFAVRS